MNRTMKAASPVGRLTSPDLEPCQGEGGPEKGIGGKIQR